jgi:exodeoxyribonuclease VII large subunit
LRRQFEALKKKLAAEGLFEAARKRPIPLLPRRLGIITSPTGAAIRDILSILRRRFPAIPVIVYPSSVQGDSAAAELRSALATAYRRRECDVLIISRGGGSLEDLWPFNDEALARTIAASPIPVVSAVGHEIDFTIADFVADVRAPTPSGAAELVAPDETEWRHKISLAATRIVALCRRHLEDRQQRLDWLNRRLAQGSPAATVARQKDWLKNLRQVLAAAMRHDLLQRSRRLERARGALLRHSPALAVQSSIYRLAAARQRLNAAATARVKELRQRLTVTRRALDSVSPQATLERGYAIVTDARDGSVLTDAGNVAAGDPIAAKLARGVIHAAVERTEDGDDKPV